MSLLAAHLQESEESIGEADKEVKELLVAGSFEVVVLEAVQVLEAGDDESLDDCHRNINLV